MLIIFSEALVPLFHRGYCISLTHERTPPTVISGSSEKLLLLTSPLIDTRLRARSNIDPVLSTLVMNLTHRSTRTFSGSMLEGMM